MTKKQTDSPAENLPVPVELIERRIYLILGQKVMIDADLADLYQVETRAFNQAVRRNLERFPEDFMFQLTEQEASALRSQTVTLDKGRGRYSKYAPLAFTEHGVAMLSSVLSSRRAAQMNILIIRAFVRLRDMLATHKDLAARMEKLLRRSSTPRSSRPSWTKSRSSRTRLRLLQNAGSVSKLQKTSNRLLSQIVMASEHQSYVQVQTLRHPAPKLSRTQRRRLVYPVPLMRRQEHRHPGPPGNRLEDIAAYG